jgi:hypothetical protein
MQNFSILGALGQEPYLLPFITCTTAPARTSR